MLLIALALALSFAYKESGSYVQKSLSTVLGGKDLKPPPARYSTNGVLDTSLTVDVFRFQTDTPINFTTRAYEQSIPGPTLRVNKGDTLRIQLINKLGADINGPMNTFHSANTSNLHVHGLHVSPEGNSDDVFRTGAPGSVLQYEYQIPNDHVSGMFWYHPHLHGATTLQISGGLAGAIIIEDDAAQTPPELAAMKEEIMVLQNLCFQSDPNDMNPYRNHLLVSQYGLDNLAINPSYVFANDYKDYYLVNGQYQPVIRMQPGEFRRLRILHAGHDQNVIIQIDGCEMYTLAWDGVYLDTPMADSSPLMCPAARLDIALRCNNTGNYSVSSNARGAPYEGDLESNTRIWTGILASIIVSGDYKEMSLPTKLPPKPSFMSDLSQIPEEDIQSQFYVLLHAEGGAVPPGTFPDTYLINGVPFEGDDQYQHDMMVGQIEEWTILSQSGGVNHPFHVHVNQFQIILVAGGTDPFINLYPGTWRDSIQTPDGISIIIRFIPDRYAGTAVLHCHMFAHNDLGMMAVTDIQNSTTLIPRAKKMMKPLGDLTQMQTDAIMKHPSLRKKKLGQ